MGFIIPGIKFQYNKKRTGRNGKAFNNIIYSNENKNFNERFPNNLYLSYSGKITKLYREISAIIKGLKSINVVNLNLLRQKLEKYIILIDELENLISFKYNPKLKKENAKNLLGLIIYIQGNELFVEINDSIFLNETPPLEAILSRKLELVEGGCILFNKFLNKQLTIDLMDKKYYRNDKIGIYKNPSDTRITLPEVRIPKIKNVIDLPDEVLVKIFSYSSNINNLLLTSKYFYNFILSHQHFISYEVIVNKYIHKYKLNFQNAGQIHSHDDENHHLNSHKLKINDELMSVDPTNIRRLISSEFKMDINKNYVLTRYKDADTLVIISSNSFNTPFMTYQNYKSLNIDHVIPTTAWKDFEEFYNIQLQSNSESDSFKLDKNIFCNFWNEFPINLPFMDNLNPNNLGLIKDGTYVDKLRIIIDLLISETRFKNNLEDILFFIVSLIIKIEENVIDDEVENESNSIVPTQIIKNYAVFYMRQNLIESDEENNGETGDNQNKSDEQIWFEIKLKNPKFYILLKQSANEEIEELIGSLFYYDKLSEEVNFWLGLKAMNATELIHELINDYDISPVPHILNLLAFQY